jgi:hypothetical protein
MGQLYAFPIGRSSGRLAPKAVALGNRRRPSWTCRNRHGHDLQIRHRALIRLCAGTPCDDARERQRPSLVEPEHLRLSRSAGPAAGTHAGLRAAFVPFGPKLPTIRQGVGAIDLNKAGL